MTVTPVPRYPLHPLEAHEGVVRNPAPHVAESLRFAHH
jgi:hypothetical protein